jgi:hypothetical protein
MLSGQHDAHMIPKGVPGAGNILVFDNQGQAGFPPSNLSAQQGSRILEIDPVTRQIVWQYTGFSSGQPVWTFFSSFISSARRLPNGNTLIAEGMNGRIFQVTRGGDIAWEYVSPHFAKQNLGLDPDDNREVLTNWLYRAQPVPYDWVPTGTARSETAVNRVNLSKFRVPTSGSEQ